MPVTWRDHRGTQVLYLDCRGLKGQELSGLLEDAAAALKKSRVKVRVLANVENVFLDQPFMEKMKTLGRTVFSEKVEKTAIVGVSGLKSVLLSSYNFLLKRNMVSHRTEAEALDWLAG